jgi:hypothetical protein
MMTGRPDRSERIIAVAAHYGFDSRYGGAGRERRHLE